MESPTLPFSPIAFRWTARLLVVICVAAAALMVLSTTPRGVGTSPDSAVYIGVADQLLHGQGLTVPFGEVPGAPLTHYPPLYPMLLAFGGWFEPNLGQSARWIQALLFSLNTLLWADFLRRLLPGRTWLAGFLLLPLVFFPALVSVHSMAWSEGLFLLLGFSGFLVALQAMQRKGWANWVIAGDLLALAFLTRYAGAAFLAAALLMAVIFSRRTLRERLLGMMLLAGPTLVAAVVWFTFAAGFGNRSPAFHLPASGRLLQALDTLSGWLLIPLSFPGWVKVGLIGLVVVGTLGLIFTAQGRDDTETQARHLARGLIAFAVVYGVFLGVVLTLVDANTPLDDRILAPLLICGYLCGAFALNRVIQMVSRPQTLLLGILIAAAGIWISGDFMQRNAALIRQGRAQGFGFYSQTWIDSPTLAAAVELPPQIPLVSNSAEALYLLSGRSAIPLPRRTDLTTGLPNEDYEQQMNALKTALAREEIHIIVFDRVQSQVTPSIEELQQVLQPESILPTADGWILSGRLP